MTMIESPPPCAYAVELSIVSVIHLELGGTACRRNAFGTPDGTINVDRVGLWIVQRKEWSREILTILSHALLGILN